MSMLSSASGLAGLRLSAPITRAPFHLAICVAALAYGGTVLGFGLWSRLLMRYSAAMVSPFALSTFMHGLIVGLLIGYGYIHNMFHGSEWGANAFQQGAIQATLVSTASLPLPQDHPPTDNVLATETPSVAPALEEQKQEPIPLPDAVPIPEKKAPRLIPIIRAALFAAAWWRWMRPRGSRSGAPTRSPALRSRRPQTL